MSKKKSADGETSEAEGGNTLELNQAYIYLGKIYKPGVNTFPDTDAGNAAREAIEAKMEKNRASRKASGKKRKDRSVTGVGEGNLIDDGRGIDQEAPDSEESDKQLEEGSKKETKAERKARKKAEREAE